MLYVFSFLCTDRNGKQSFAIRVVVLDMTTLFSRKELKLQETVTPHPQTETFSASLFTNIHRAGINVIEGDVKWH